MARDSAFAGQLGALCGDNPSGEVEAEPEYFYEILQQTIFLEDPTKRKAFRYHLPKTVAVLTARQLSQENGIRSKRRAIEVISTKYEAWKAQQEKSE